MILIRKVLRSIVSQKKAYFSCIFLLSIGIMIYITMGILNISAQSAKEEYYKEYRLADVFVKVNSIPVADVEKLYDITGVEDVSHRIVFDVKALVDGYDKNIVLRLISAPIEENPINNFMFIDERGIGKKNDQISLSNEIIVGNNFLKAHQLTAGDALTFTALGKSYEYVVKGGAQSPEFAYAIKDITELLPDERSFTFAYIKREELASIANRQGQVNDVVITLASGVSFDSVKAEFYDILSPYGIIEITEKKNQISYSMIESELDGIKSMSTSIPFMFISISIVVLYIMLKRLIEQERTQMGTLKAFGYTKWEILFHYLCYGIITGFSGGVLGAVLGYFASLGYINLFKQYFNLPTLRMMASASYFIKGIIIASAAGGFGAYAGAKKMLTLNPAEAMRPPSPMLIQKSLLPSDFLPPKWKMALRSIARNKIRSLLVALGVTFSFGIMSYMASYDQMMDDMLISMFTKIQVYDLKLGLKNITPYEESVEAAYRLENIVLAEGLLEIPFILKYKNITKGAVVIGLEQNATLFKIYDLETDRAYPPPEDGVIVTSSIAKALRIKAGDVIYLSSQLLADDIPVVVKKVVTQSLGGNCYTNIHFLSELLNSPKSVSAIIAKTNHVSALNQVLLNAENVSHFQDAKTTLHNYTEFLQTYTSMIYLMELMGILVAFAIMYNTSNISLAERKREYATLRVLGFSVGEIANILNIEYGLLCFLGVLLGFPFVSFLKTALSEAISVDAFTMPTTTPPEALAVAAAGCLIAAFFSSLSAIKQIKKFVLADVLKERE